MTLEDYKFLRANAEAHLQGRVDGFPRCQPAILQLEIVRCLETIHACNLVISDMEHQPVPKVNFKDMKTCE